MGSRKDHNSDIICGLFTEIQELILLFVRYENSGQTHEIINFVG
jgi:hypothetical protein